MKAVDELEKEQIVSIQFENSTTSQKITNESKQKSINPSKDSLPLPASKLAGSKKNRFRR